MICPEWAKMKMTEWRVMMSEKKNSRYQAEVSDELMNQIAAGNDPETMSKDDLKSLIHHYRNMAQQMMNGGIYNGGSGVGRSIDACNSCADTLQEVYLRRFPED